MRKVKSTALLGAFVAVASVGVISHEAHGTTIGGFLIENISKEMLPNSVSLSTPDVTSNVSYPNQSGISVTLTLSGANFIKGDYYGILGAGSYTACAYGTVNGTTITPAQVPSSGLNSLTLSCNAASLTSGTSYSIVGGGNLTLANDTSFSVYVPQTSSSIVLGYSSNVSGDSSTSVTLANVMPQLSVSPNSVTKAVISASSGGNLFTDNFPSATNSVGISNNEYSGQWTNKIETFDSTYTINFLFTNIPTSVTSVGAVDTNTPTPQSAGPVTPGNQSATIAFSLSSASAPFLSSSTTDKINFSFTNSGNIIPGTIVLSSIIGSGTIGSGSSVSYVYSSTTQPFINFEYTGVQIYVPDALAPDNNDNDIKHAYITISMPSSTDITGISVLNDPNASCPVPSFTNGALVQTSTSGVYYIDLSQLAPLCTGLSPFAWQSGVPLVINLSGSNVGPNTVTADGYAIFDGRLKRIPVVIVSNSTGSNVFSY